MTSESTSLALANSASDEWQRYLDFLKRPVLPGRVSGISSTGLVATLRMLGLDLLVMLGLVLVAGLLLALGFEFPDNEINALKWTPQIIALVVIGAPLMEEIAFRSWLSGRPGHVLAILLVGASLLAAVTLGPQYQQGGGIGRPAPALISIVCVMFAALALFLLRKRGPMGWFSRLFPLLYWLSTVCFALVHLLNYTEGAAMVLLPLVLPQLVTGSILGYVRTHYGLWSSILLHALHNGAAVGMVLLSLKLGLE